MAIREVRIMGDDILEKQCKPVTKMTMRTKILIEDMLDTMYEKYGVGLRCTCPTSRSGCPA